MGVKSPHLVNISISVADREIFYLNILIAIMALAAVIWLVVFLLRRDYLNIRAHAVNANASVLSKRKSILLGRSVTSPSHCYAEFEFNDGTIRKFRIPRKDYEALVLEDSGTLVYQGTKFIRFESI